MKKDVLIIFGGNSPEYEVSCKSASYVLENINKDLFEPIMLGITRDGKWYVTEATVEEIRNAKDWCNSLTNKKVMFDLNYNSKTIYVANGSELVSKNIDVVFPLIHGETGEDGKIQGMFDIMNIAYVGSGVLSSSCSMDKAITRLFADSCGLKQPNCFVVEKQQYLANKEDILNKINLGYPVFVKPACTGSSIGVSKVESFEQLQDAIETAMKFDNKVLVEQGIVGSEIKVAILGNNDLAFGAICEINVNGGTFNDYNTKYIANSSVKKIPANIEETLKDEILSEAEKIYRALDCKGFARVDFFLTEDKEIIFNEINTIPGFSKGSIYSLMFDCVGINYKDLITELINTSFTK